MSCMTKTWNINFYRIFTVVFWFSVFSPLNSLLNASAVVKESKVWIAEIMAHENTILHDEDGDIPDWLELFNEGPFDVNLAGWYLTDDPNRLTKWSFPETILPVNRHLVVFASSKNRKNTAGPLHTNFNLSDSGEYLALVYPDGKTIAHEYAPYPDQNTPKHGFTYGLTTIQSTIVSNQTGMKYWVPSDGNLGSSWIQPEFNDSSWKSGTIGAGYGSTPGKFTVTTYKANTEVTSLSNADAVIRDPKLQIRKDTILIDVINFLDNDEDGHFTNNQPFPGYLANQNIDDFVVLATATIVVPQSGLWTFGINSDDGARLRINGQNVIVDDRLHSPADTFGTVELNSGVHELELVYFERNGGAQLELFAASGARSSFVLREFRLVGETSTRAVGLAGFSTLVNTNLEADMKTVNSSVYLRIPFEMSDPSIPYLALFRIKFNDGFIAYLNGNEILRQNAPSIAAWNSSSIQALPPESGIGTMEIALSNFHEIDFQKHNVLAIHGLNDDPNDSDFLLAPELKLTAVQPDQRRFFKQPTPGKANGDNGVVGFVSDISIAPSHGFYDKPFSLTITPSDPASEIRYTLDGTEPTQTNGSEYNEPISIDQTTVIRAAAFKTNHEPSIVKTCSYIFVDDVITQTRPEGYPTVWGSGVSGDYDMDPDIVNHPSYKNTIKTDLKSLPVVSVVMDPKDLFDRAVGIYVNTTNKGEEWERPASTELFFADGRQGFQINHGIRIQGGYSRLADRRKHSFRLLFKRQYGPTKLEYPLFENTHVQRFDQVVLRGGYNYTWHFEEGGFGVYSARADYLRDEFSRRLQLSTGQPAVHGRYVHLYLNGMYWGLYNLTERPDDGYAASYFGGEKEEYDVITGGTRDIGTTQVKGGNKDAWNQMITIAERGNLANPVNYQELQKYVDFDNLIDYMLTIYYTGNRDAPTIIGGGGTPWNFYSNRRRVPGAGFRFYCWDSEWTLEDVNRNVIEFHNGRDNPARVFHRLLQNPEFRIRVADRVQKHFFNGGCFTVEKATGLYIDLALSIEQAIVGESARWGDARSSRPKTRDDDWRAEIYRIVGTYLPQRTGIVLDQLKAADLYPPMGAPVFSRHGGLVEQGYPLAIEIDEYKTKDPVVSMLMNFDHPWKFNQSGTDLGTAWRSASFNDTGWNSGKGLFYVETSDLPAPKNTPLQLGRTTYYFRGQFTVPDEFDPNTGSIEMVSIIDDGAVVYINGTEVLRLRMPEGVISNSTFASSTITNAVEEGPFKIPAAALRHGVNTIAVEVHQTNVSSSDIVFGLAIAALSPPPDPSPEPLPVYVTLDGSDPRLPGGAINPSSILYTQPLPLTRNTTVKARALDGSMWSALTEADFLIDTPPSDLAFVQTYLRITEMMYNPVDGSDFEYIELHNTHPSTAMVLNNLAFTAGIQFMFPAGTQIPPNGYLLVTHAGTETEMNLFRNVYKLDSSVLLTGPYTGNLSNGGEEVRLSMIDGAPVIEFEYGDGSGWPVAADGAGHSLIPTALGLINQHHGSLYYGKNWRPSYSIGGSPGRSDREPHASLVINEFKANTTYRQADDPLRESNDWIELFNPTVFPVNLANYFLSDDQDNLRKWQLPNMQFEPAALIGFDELTHFNNPLGTGFGLSKEGEEIYLSYLPGEPGVDRVVDAIVFDAQEDIHSFGRFNDGGEYWYAMRPTRNGPNSDPIPHAVIDEIMYNPSDNNPSLSFEFIELHNPLDVQVPLWNENGSWRISSGIDFVFPFNMTLQPQERVVVVGFDPSDQTLLHLFSETYPNGNPAVRILGPYEGKLSNNGERITLEKPLTGPGTGFPASWVVVDEAIYFNQTPWTDQADGTGLSLQRISTGLSGNDPSNWLASIPTPGEKRENDTQIRMWSLY